ncbi:hypothetical protein HMPREF1548_05714 [Clostridium sp. KLE 1755]|nr:hypothetical protein HMPREF1548_05714 [Clostridium sp. KLE 1755]
MPGACHFSCNTWTAFLAFVLLNDKLPGQIKFDELVKILLN